MYFVSKKSAYSCSVFEAVSSLTVLERSFNAERKKCFALNVIFHI